MKPVSLSLYSEPEDSIYFSLDFCIFIMLSEHSLRLCCVLFSRGTEQKRKKKCFILTFGVPSLLCLRQVRFHEHITDIRALPLMLPSFTLLVKTKL